MFSLVPVFLPMAAAVMLLFDSVNNAAFRRVYIKSVTFASAAAALFAALYAGPETVTLWDASAGGISIAFRVDELARFFCVLLAVIWPLVTIYAFEYLAHRPPEGRFFAFLTASFGVLAGLVCAANFMTLYMFYELLTFLTLPLVMHSQQRESMRGAVKYLLYSIVGAALALTGFFFFHVYGVSTNFTAGGVIDAAKAAGHKDTLLTASFLALLGFGAKAGLFPLHSWLPSAHPVAPTPASAVLSGLITKAGAISMIRVAYFITGPDFLRGTWVQTAVICLSLTTIFMGSMMAYVEKHLKKRIAWSSVSQVSYVVFGMMLFTRDGLTGALIQIAAHSFAKSCLFLAAGIVIYFRMRGSNYHYVDQLRGVGRELPFTMTCFAAASLSIVGLPPTIGFTGKWFTALGALECGPLGLIGAAVLMLSALLTAGYLLSMVSDAFFPGNDYDKGEDMSIHLTLNMRLPIVILSAGAVLAGVFAGPLVRYLSNFAASLM